MSNRNIKEISKKAYRIFIGIFLCLLGVSLCLNAGLCAKGLSFSFSYVLGLGSFLLYTFLFVEGVILMLKNKSFSALSNKYFWFAIIFLIGASGLVTYILVDQSALYLSFGTGEGQAEITSKLVGNFDQYFNKQYFDMFVEHNEVGCGILGYAILALGNSLFEAPQGGLIFSIVIMATGVALIVIVSIVEAAKNSKKTVSSKKKDKENPLNSHKRIKNINVVKGAKKINPETYHSEVSGAGRNIEKFNEEILETPEVSINNLRDAVLTEDSLEPQLANSGVQNESLDEFKQPVFNLDDVAPKIVVNEPVIKEKFEPIGENPSFDYQETQAEQIVVPELSTKIETRIEPAKNEYAPIKNEPVIQPKTIQQPVYNNSTSGVQNVQTPSAKEDTTPAVAKKERVNFQVIKSDILETYETAHALEVNQAMAAERKEIINNTFKDFGVGAEVMDYTIGPSITRYNIRYNSNVSSRSVANLVQDISIRLNGVGARFESVIEGQSTSGLEIPNAEITTVAFKDVYDALPDPKKHPLAVAFGKNIKGSVIYADYDEFPHMLISGTTGSGKSVFVNSIICTLIMRNSPDDLKLVLVDPKKVEMSRYADMPHLLTPIITEATKVKLVLDKLVDEMEYRYSLFSKNNATNIKEYNEDCEFNGNERIPYIVVILDEYADLVEQCKDISLPVVGLAQKARACGIHIMLSTQRPSTNVVTGVIKANMPTHVALMTANYVDSTTIIGEGGAEKLLGKGDMLVQSPLVSRVGVCRLQSCFINRREIIRIVTELKSKYPTNFDSNFLNLEEQKPSEYASSEAPSGAEGDEETKYRSIREWVMAQEYMSMSKIQRDCGVGFNRAGRFFNRLQQEGIVAAESEGSKGCRVLVSNKFGDIDDDDLIPTSEENSYIK